MSDQPYSETDSSGISNIDVGPGVRAVEPMSSGPTTSQATPRLPANPNADREGQLSDGVLDRDAGEDYNPNSNATVEANRARFEAANVQITKDHAHLADEVIPVMERVAEEAKAAAQLPEHQAMIPEQIAHAASDPLATHAGSENPSVMPPLLRDGGLSPKPVDKAADIADPNGPAIPVQNNSLRQDR